MLISAVSPTFTSPIPAPADRSEAAQNLVSVPATAVLTSMSAYHSNPQGTLSRADCVNPLLQRIPLDALEPVMVEQMDRAIAMEPALNERRDGMLQAIAGARAVIAEAAADTVVQPAADAANAVIAALNPYLTVLMEAARVLVPSSQYVHNVS